jgi:hypothetical protein
MSSNQPGIPWGAPPSAPTDANAPKSRRWLINTIRLWSVWIIIGIAILMIAPGQPWGLGNSSRATPTSTVAAKALTVGSTGEANGFRITLNEVRHETRGIKDPKPGMEYLIVNLTIENITDWERGITSVIDFRIKYDKDPRYEGRLYGFADTTGARTRGNAEGLIAPHSTLRGEVAFEMPRDLKGLVFTYAPQYISNHLLFKLDS